MKRIVKVLLLILVSAFAVGAIAIPPPVPGCPFVKVKVVQNVVASAGELPKDTYYCTAVVKVISKLKGLPELPTENAKVIVKSEKTGDKVKKECIVAQKTLDTPGGCTFILKKGTYYFDVFPGSLKKPITLPPGMVVAFAIKTNEKLEIKSNVIAEFVWEI